MSTVIVRIENATIKDYYELEKILNRNGVDTKVFHKDSDETELGLSFEELVILLPLLTPIAAEIRKALEAYFDYKKTQIKKLSLVLEKNDKKMEITSENEKFPSVEDFNSFFEES